ncbi:hypothetical protein [Glaciecola sp. SC05]|uniref:hypothetical protein n=1 Tax=Glaciecola sp. SC05 TaxID=1987355 RepID=UPI003527372B
MISTSQANNLSPRHKASDPVFTLVLDDHTDVGMSDKPIFGTSVTIREDIESLIGCVLQAGLIVGWLNYIDVTKFACISDGKHYQEASNYFHTKSNQLVLSKPILLHKVDTSMNRTKQLFTFSASVSNVHSINEKST